MGPSRDLPQEATPRLADFIVRWRWAIVLVTVLLTGVAGWRATKLKLKTAMEELLPEKDPAVVVMREMSARLEAISNVVVAVQGPDPAVNRRFVDDLVPRLRALGLAEIAAVEYGVGDERAFLDKNKFLYASLDQLESAESRLRRAILKRKNPAFVDLAGDDGEGESLAARRAQLDKRERELLDKFPDGYYATQDRHLYAVVVRVRGSIFGERHGERVAKTVQGVINQLQPARYGPHLSVGLTGDVMNAIAEREALEDDLLLATTVCVLLVGLVIFLFYGRFRAIPYVIFSAVCGVTFALAFAQLAFGYLNASTAFMGSIIVGNGINYAIIQMARYEEERRQGRGVRDAIAVAIGGTWRATVIASVGAAIAYGSLAITAFRGFNQFGYIGGVGMILSWVVTVLSLPALWALLDRRQGDALRPRVKGFAVTAPLARFTVQHPRLLLLAGVVLSLAAVAPLPRYLKDPFEYDFRKLGNQASRGRGGVETLSNQVGKIFGRSLSPSFILADKVSQVEEIRRKLRENDSKYHILGDIKTINDFLPGTPEQQREKLEVLARIRTLIDKNAGLLEDKEKADAERLRPPDDLRVIQAKDLPMSLRRYFTEIDGTVGRPVVYFPREKGVTVWDGRTQLKLAAVTHEVRLDDGSAVRSSGKAAIFSGMLTAITHDGPIATAAAWLGVAILVVVLTFRRGGWLLTLGVLVVGVLWMVGAAAYGGVRVNFLNFIALPITFGINVDYAINLLLRYQLEGRGRVRQAVEATGAAVALCSLTTIIGYGALLVADNQALRSFGAMAIIGEFACLAAALVLMPAALVLLERRGGPRAAAAPVAARPGNGRTPTRDGAGLAEPPAPRSEAAPPPSALP